MECTTSEARQNLTKMIKRFPQLDMIVCDSDERAELIAEAAAMIGLDCPGQIALSGAGNMPGIGKRWNFASLDQHPALIGSTACGILIDQIEGKNHKFPIREYIPPSPVNFFCMKK